MPSYKAIKPYKTLVYGNAPKVTVPVSYGDFQLINTQFLTWCDAIAKVSQLFMNAELKSRLSDAAPAAVLGFSNYYRDKFKDEDQETRIERLEFILSKMKMPTNGLTLTMYEVFDQYVESERGDQPGLGVTWPFNTLNKWDLIDTWNAPESDYVSVQLTEGRSYLTGVQEHMAIEDEIMNVLSRHNANVKYVDYSMTSEDVYETVLNAKYHISYCGASWWLAHALNVPVYSYGKRYASDKDLYGTHSSGVMGHGYPYDVPVAVEDGRFVHKRVRGPGHEPFQDRSIADDMKMIGAI